jgi:hypothetical protein
MSEAYIWYGEEEKWLESFGAGKFS